MGKMGKVHLMSQITISLSRGKSQAIGPHGSNAQMTLGEIVQCIFLGIKIAYGPPEYETRYQGKNSHNTIVPHK